MEEEACGEWQVFNIGLIFVTCFAILIVVPKLSRKLSRLFGWFGIGECPTSQQDITDIKKATFQITKDWADMVDSISNLREDQANFVTSFHEQMETQKEELYHNIIVSLEEEFLRNDQRFSKIKMIIESIQEDFLFMKNLMMNAKPQIPVDSDYEVSKLNMLVKKCLGEIFEDAKLYLYNDREQENKELEAIFLKLAEDREYMRKTIVHAFSIAAEQAKKNFDNFERAGQDAIHYICRLYQNTNKMLNIKLEKTDSRLKEILAAMNRQKLDINTIRNVLENIDGQFDDIFQRIELGCQKNTETCEEMAQNVEKVSENWSNAASDLANMKKDLSKHIQTMSDLLIVTKNMKASTRQKTSDRESNEIVGYHSIISNLNREWPQSQQQHNMFMYSMIQACWDKLTCMNDRVENGCIEICELVEILSQKLQSLNRSVDKIDETIKGIEEDGLASIIPYLKCSANDSKDLLTMGNISIGDSGDGQSEVFQIAETHSPKLTREQKIQEHSTVLREKEIKIIELLLKKVSQVGVENNIDTCNVIETSPFQEEKSFFEEISLPSKESEDSGLTKLVSADSQENKAERKMVMLVQE